MMEQEDSRSLRVLVTGGAGFIGSHLVDRLLDTGADVRVLDNLSTGRIENLAHCADRIEFVEGDIRDLESCQDACRGVDAVLHQAALGSIPRSLEDPATTIAVNVTGTANVFSACRNHGVKRVVYASSSSVYGDSELLPKAEGSEGNPLSPYAMSKKMCEELADQFSRSFAMEMVGLRYFNVFGPRQSPDGPYAAVIPRFFSALLAGEAPTVFGDGEQSRDFTPVSDAVQANLLAMTAPKGALGRAFNVATGRRTTINTLAQEIAALVGSSLRPILHEPRPGDVLHSHADLSRIRELLGYGPGVSLSQGLADCLDYYREISS